MFSKKRILVKAAFCLLVISTVVILIDGIAEDIITAHAHNPNKANQSETTENVGVSTARLSSPLVEPQKIFAPDGIPHTEFGQSIAGDGNTLVIGAYQDRVGSNVNQGSVYVYVRSDGTNWSQQAKLTASDGAPNDTFGGSVAVYGDTIAVGARGDDVGSNNEQGSVYIFTRSGSTWTEQTKLLASDPAFGDNFGAGVAINQNAVVVGTPNKDTGAVLNHGAAYVFSRTGGSWFQQAKLVAADFAANDEFGERVDIDGNTIIVSAAFDDISATNQGSAYIFTKSQENWVQQAKLMAQDGAAFDFFGNSVAVSGDMALIGVPRDEAPTIFDQGSVYVFDRQGEVWTQQAKLTAPDAAIGDGFGNYVDLSGNTAVIGSPGDDVNANSDQGSAYVFTRDGNTWLPPGKLLAPDATANEQFGLRVAATGNQIFVGIPIDLIGSNPNQGSVYFFLKPPVAPDLRAASDSGASNSDNVTNSRNLIFDVGGVTVGAAVEFLRNGVVIATTTATAATITFTDPDPPANGVVRYSARQIVNGEESNTSSTDITIDTTPPVFTIDLLLPQRDPTNASSISFKFTLNEQLTGFNASHISLAGSTANVSAAVIEVVFNQNFYRVTISNILSDGTVTVSVPAGVISDLAGNLNSASVHIDNTVTYDTVGPTVTINQASDQADPTAALPVKYTVIFSEPVTGFDWQDLVFTGSTATVFSSPSNIVITGGGTTYTVALNGVISNGQFVQAGIRSGAVSDLADNPSFASTSTDNRVTVDNVAPSVTVNQAPGQPDPASTQPINFTVVFNEPVSGFDAADVSLNGSTANVSQANITVSGSGPTFNVSVSNITSSGQVRASVVAGAAQDSLGNPNLVSTGTDNTVTFNLKRSRFDYDGDGKADLSVFRPSAGSWYISNSSNNAFTALQFGAAGDLIAPADFDGDGKTDICVFRPSDGGWYRLNSSNNTFTPVQFGTNGDLPVPGDFDGDGKADLTVYRPSAGSWFRINSSNNQFVAVQFGVAEDKPIVGDFDGDGKSDLTVFRPSNGTWYRINSATDTFSPAQFGAPGDLPVAADYDGDGKTDLAVYRPSVGDWYWINSSNSSFTGLHFGVTEDKPAPADFDGDGKADLVVFRPSSGTWYLLRTTAGFTGFQFGANGDIPTPNAFVR